MQNPDLLRSASFTEAMAATALHAGQFSARKSQNLLFAFERAF
ncbi:hypothetical protein [Candidatus Skiveiella danica]